MRAVVLGTVMDAWPPVTTHVRVDVPFMGHEFLAIMRQGPEFGGAQGTYVCPAGEDGRPVGMFMTAFARLDYCGVGEALTSIGYEVAAEPEPGPETEPEPEPEPELFDPSAHTVDEVNTYLSTADPVEAERVLEAERAGKSRIGILGKDL